MTEEFRIKPYPYDEERWPTIDDWEDPTLLWSGERLKRAQNRNYDPLEEQYRSRTRIAAETARRKYKIRTIDNIAYKVAIKFAYNKPWVGLGNH